jgi:hypothetical protein
VEPECSRQNFEKHSNIKFYENSSNGSRVVPCGSRDGQGGKQAERQADMTKLTVAFSTFANAPTIVDLFPWALPGPAKKGHSLISSCVIFFTAFRYNCETFWRSPLVYLLFQKVYKPTVVVALIQVIFRVRAHGPKCRAFQVSEREIPLLLSESARSLKLKRGDHHLFLVTGLLARLIQKYCA